VKTFKDFGLEWTREWWGMDRWYFDPIDGRAYLIFVDSSVVTQDWLEKPPDFAPIFDEPETAAAPEPEQRRPAECREVAAGRAGWPCWWHWYRVDRRWWIDPCQSCTPLIDLADYWLAEYAERAEREELIARMWRLG
jgi:hypothetical protein